MNCSGVSPIGMKPTDVVDWKFVEFRDVPIGPWSRFGENNTFVIEARKNQTRVVQGDRRKEKIKDNLPLPSKDDGDGPAVITRQ